MFWLLSYQVVSVVNTFLMEGFDIFICIRSNVAMLHVYFKEKTGMRYRTDIRFGKEDFICNYDAILQFIKPN